MIFFDAIARRGERAVIVAEQGDAAE